MRRLALAGLLALAGCNSTPPLPPIAPPTPPTVIKVPVLQPIPASMTAPCAEPSKRPLTTDVELLEAADAFKVEARCNAAKLKAIETAGDKLP